MECAEDGCGTEAVVELHLPRADNRVVCAGHARTLARRDGVVADTLETASEEMPDGAANRDES